MALKVHERSALVNAMAEDWSIVEALIGGTKTMRAAGERFLPKWPNEDLDSYRTRLSVATLFNAFSRTLSVMAGKPFSKELTLADDAPVDIRAWREDIDREGHNLHTFASELMQEALAFGISGVLVEHPRAEGVRTRADEKLRGLRPYLVRIGHDQVLGWKTQKIDGVTVLTQLRLQETEEVDDGAYGASAVNRVRVLEPGSWALYEAGDDGEYSLIEEGKTSLNFIPYVPFYGRRTGFMTGVSPLLDLAYLNVKHWQSQSDQDTILHVARVPILAMVGAEDDTELTVGASAAVKLPQGADLKFVEHSGAAIAAGEKALEKLEDQMIRVGAELVVPSPGNKTATESNNDAEANKCELQRIVEGFEDSLDLCLQYMAKYVGQPEGGHVSIFKDFAAGSMSQAVGQLILAFQAAGLITKHTAIKQAQRIGVLSPDIDPDDEIERVSEEGPPLGLIEQ